MPNIDLDEDKQIPAEFDESVPPPFDPQKARHKVALERLAIAKWILLGLAILLLCGFLLLYVLPINAEDKREILANILSSLFSAITLTIGFIAGSSIDSK